VTDVAKLGLLIIKNKYHIKTIAFEGFKRRGKVI